MSETEIVAPVDLCLPGGRLNRAAHGWARRPRVRSNLRGWGRTKRWEYWGIVTPDHVLGVVVSSLDYAGVHGVYLLERSSGREWVHDAVVPFARGAVLPDEAGVGRAVGVGKDLRIEIDQHRDGAQIEVSARDVQASLSVPNSAERESLGVVVPWSDRLFQHTVKDVGRPATGTLTVAGVAHPLPEDSFAVLDHGRGRWPYRITWNWAAAHGPDGVSLTLGGRWTQGTGSTENAVFVDGRLHKISTELTWTYDRSDWMRPWRITGAGVDLGFEPFHVRVAKTELGVVGSRTHQAFGHFRGWVDLGDQRVPVEGLTGWAEEARQRW